MVATGVPCLLWQDLKPEHIAELDTAIDVEATKAILVAVLQLNDTENPLRQEVLLEMFVNLLECALCCQRDRTSGVGATSWGADRHQPQRVRSA